ncbi:MAG: valine--tRNA ligase [Deltaproteobacteria bacterium]|nr:valine--tRNA ligase [Deltaproteobacteria bacterium]
MSDGSDATLPKQYSPSDAESRWYEFWESNGFFEASRDPDDPRPTYTVAIPPPNVTGTLHMGHACRTTFEDVLTRFHRMKGHDALWIPGMDHAGIATQVVVERILRAEGKTRHDLGREKFVERVWEWKEKSGGRILEQLRKMGASCDWSQTHFTMDEDLNRAVREAFVRLYEEGLIYRGERLVNWDVATQTVLSDLEVDTEEGVQGELFEFAYPIDGEEGELVVATTRPETMLGDTAVAIHPDDERYTHLHGKFVKHPFVDRRIPIVCDAELVDMQFGTGAVKVTPAHDPNDFETGKRHDLELINILNLDGTLNDEGGPFAGMERFAARKAVKAKLEEVGLARGTKKHTMTLPRSQRSGTVVEPMISTQWFVKMEPLAKPALAAVEDGRVQILPADWKKTYDHWLENIHDWCISRQLWWGHAIPAWYCEDCDHVTVSREDATECGGCGGSTLRQDSDVLDTWFSSALWPFSTLGWPEKTPDLARYYPTQDLETGYDILFFWVARMIMMGLHFMGEVPFSRVLLAGMVTDEKGDKMSKVKGNVIDPLDVINGATLDDLLEKAQFNGAQPKGLKYLKKTYADGFPEYGTDALRMTLLSYSPQARRIALSLKRVEGYRNFSNKLWNAARFSLMNLEGSDAKATGEAPKVTTLTNRWILSRLARALETANAGLEAYRLDDASGALYHFVWDELCDWYLELTKPAFAEGADPAIAAETRQTLVHVFETVLRALHPMMPFITEEIWQKIPKSDALGAHPRDDSKPRSLIVARYPQPGADARVDEAAEKALTLVQAAIGGARQIRSEHQVPWSKPIELVYAGDDTVRAVLSENQGLVEALIGGTVRAESAEKLADATQHFENAAVFVAEGIHGAVPNVIDPAKERERLERQLGKVDKELTKLEKKLANDKFVSNAPAEVVEKVRAEATALADEKKGLDAALARL